MKNIKKYFVGVVLFISFVNFGFAADYYKSYLDNSRYSGNGTSRTSVYSIDEHNVNKRVSKCSNTYFIPTKTSAEWLAFRNNLPSGCALSDPYWTLGVTSFPMILK